MKARIGKLTVDVFPDDGRYYDPSDQTYYDEDDLIFDDEYNWQAFRREAAKVAMQGILASGDNGWSLTLAEGYKPGEKHSYPIGIARFAIACADELIKQLKQQ